MSVVKRFGQADVVIDLVVDGVRDDSVRPQLQLLSLWPDRLVFAYIIFFTNFLIGIYCATT